MREIICFQKGAVLKTLLESFGLLFNPFGQLEASGDPHLSEYLVGHDSFALASEDAPALVGGLPGAGKTAMRFYVSRSCTLSYGGMQPLPVNYSLPNFFAFNSRPISLQQHQQKFLQAGAAALFLSLGFHPGQFLELSHAVQHRLAAFWQRYLPVPLAYCNGILHETGNVHILLPLLDRAYIPSSDPEPTGIEAFSAALDSLKNTPAFAGDVEAGFEELLELTLGEVEFRSIFWLVDGVDAFPETARRPELAADLLSALIEQALAWTSRRLYLKAFVPEESLSSLSLPAGLKKITRQVNLCWTPELLAELLRRRVYVASRGRMGSLDAVSGPGLYDIETTLARSALPLPREAICLAGRVLEECARREQQERNLLAADVTAALNWYQRNTPAGLFSRTHHSIAVR